jgi:hypothetical protein
MVRIQVRRDTASNWNSNNPTLLAGEHGYETDTKKYKIGDGTSTWTALGYKNEVSSLVNGPGSMSGQGGKAIRVNAGATINSHIWYDRLAHMGGLNGTLTTAQTVGVVLTTAVASGRCLVTGADVEWYLEWYTATGSTAVTATVTYTDQTDTSRTTTVSIPASTAASRLIRIIPGAGGYYIKSVTSVQLSATTATAGSFGVTAAKRLCGYTIPVANTGIVLDFAGTGFPEVKESACLWLAYLCSTTSTGIVFGQLNIAIG